MPAPLHLSQVLEEEYEALHGEIPAGERSWLLRPMDLPTPADLAAALGTDAHEVSRALRPQLAPALAGAVSPDALARALNTLLHSGRLLYDPGRVPGVAVPEDVRALARQRPAGDDLVHLNRLLLEAAYPGLIASAHDARLRTIWRRIHGLAERRAALCLSGGGIRSATFALGVLQGFARAGFLDRFHYLSTVSGGGYIGSWLTAWSHRHPQGAAGVAGELAAPPAAGLTPEPRPVHRLRDYSNYLSPRLGLLSADTWTLVAIYLRNLLLNWLVLVPLLLAALALPRLVVALVRWTPAAAPAVGWPEAMLGLGFGLSVIALAYIGYERPSHAHHRRRTAGQAAFLGSCLAPLLAAALALALYWAWRSNAQQAAPGWPGFLLVGALVHLGAFIAHSVLLRHRDPVGLLVVVPSGALAGLVAWWVATSLLPEPVAAIAPRYAAFAVPALLGVILVAATLFVGLASRRTSDEDREWWARAGAWILIAMVGWAGASALVIWGPTWIAGLTAWVASLGGASALLTALLGRSATTAGPQAVQRPSGPLALLREYAPRVAAPVAAACIVVFLSMATDGLLVGLDRARRALGLAAGGLPADPALHARIVSESDPALIVILVALLLGLSLLMSAFVDVNKFSLHAMYRNRLIRAYLGASRPVRRPNPFTGFDPEDNIRLREIQATGPRRPLHVVNMALNLVAGRKLAWQERKAETFTATALHAGSYHVGYRRAAEYGGPQGMSLGTAVAISGAAASPNMGYHSSPPVTFLLTLFNARLGWWLGNPGVHGARTHRRSSPGLAFGPILAEALGLTDDRRPYVYLSDGGHFDNLGLVEMVLRRAHIIVVSDAGCDPDYALDDLGAAIRKIRIDLGVPITLGPLGFRPRDQGPGACCAVGRIGYSAVDGPDVEDGWLVVLKPALHGGEPADVLAYARRNPLFPQEPTADQWFSESQFESYRRLGLHEVQAIFGAGTGTLDDLVARAEQHTRNAP